MANSKAKNFLLGNLLVLLGLACAIIAIFMPFANGLKLVDSGNSTELRSGFSYVFGVKGGGLLGGDVPNVAVATAGWILILIGTLLAVAIIPLAFMTKNGLRIGKFTFGQVLGAGAALLLLVGGILFFFVALAYANYLGVDVSNVALGPAFVLGGIAAVAGAVFCCLPLFVTLKK